MARLSLEDIKLKLKRPKNRDNLYLAVKQERRLTLHTEAVQDRRQLNSAFGDFISWVQSFLPADKWETFNKLITLPVPTNEQAETIYTEIKKVFEAQDAQKQLFFVDSAYQKDAEEYLQRQRITNFMQTTGWEAIKLQLCSYVVVDMPTIQLTPRPEPYTYIVNVASILDVDLNSNLQVEYIIWQVNGPNKEQQFCIIDCENYWLLQKAEQGDDYSVVIQNRHSIYDANGVLISGLGYSPAHKIYTAASRSTNYVDSIGPVTNQLGDLDWYWLEKVSYRYFSLYGYYPIIVAYEQECNYREPNTGYFCENGRVTYMNGDKQEWRDCPKCTGKKALGPGSFWTAKAPRTVEETDLVKNPVTVVETASTDKLQFAQDSLAGLKKEIFRSCVGFDGEQMNASAKNEDQVAAGFESRQSVLAKVATNIDIVESFIYNTALILRYGNLYLGSNISKGSQFYLQTAEEADEAYKVAKDAGKPQHELEQLRITANNIKNKNNPAGRERIIIEQALEPWCDLSIAEVQLLQLNLTNPEDFYVKINFGTYIARFERENMNIVEFGSQVNFNVKINNILLRLREYAKETIKKEKPLPAPAPVNKNSIAA